MNRQHRLAALAAATTLALCAQGAFAAQRVDLQKLDANRVNQQYKAVTARMGVAAQAQNRHAEMLGLDADSSLRVLRTSVDRAGNSDASPLTMRPNSLRTLPSLPSLTTTCSPHTGTPRKVCW